MSLIGDLEELGLGEILRIIGLSYKSGVLRLRSRGREATIVFRKGLVVRATATTFQESFGEALIRKGKLDLPTLRAALARQEREGFRDCLGTILVKNFGFSPAVIEEVAREQLERVLYMLSAWVEGSFEFEMGDEVPAIGAIGMDPLRFMVDPGLEAVKDPLKGERGRDPFRDVPYERQSVAASSVPHRLMDLGEELRHEMGEELLLSDWEGFDPTPGMTLLQGMLEELHDPTPAGGVILLVLRFAAEFMGRAVIFMVTEQMVAGVGQFGLENVEGSADERVRSLRIPRGEPSLFSGIIEARHPAVVRPEDNQWNRYLFDLLGAGIPSEVFLGPIVSGGEVVAILYGDNLPDHRPVSGTAALEIFLSQAGLAMEKALQESKLRGVK